MDLASVVAALASVGVRVSGSTRNNNIQGDSSRACPTGLAGPEPSGTINDRGQHFHKLLPLVDRTTPPYITGISDQDYLALRAGVLPGSWRRQSSSSTPENTLPLWRSTSRE